MEDVLYICMDRSCRSNVCFVVLTILLMRAEVVIAFFSCLLAAYLGKSSNLYLCVSFMYICVSLCAYICICNAFIYAIYYS